MASVTFRKDTYTHTHIHEYKISIDFVRFRRLYIIHKFIVKFDKQKGENLTKSNCRDFVFQRLCNSYIYIYI